jgi:hypothetical protein
MYAEGTASRPPTAKILADIGVQKNEIYTFVVAPDEGAANESQNPKVKAAVALIRLSQKGFSLRGI